MEDKFPKEFSEEEIRDLFDRLDISHDGLLDINELGSSTFFRYKDSIRNERRFWDGLCKVPWVDREQLLAKFEDDPEGRDKLNNIMKKMNIEYNPYLTFWQFLRSADSELGNEFAEIIQGKDLTPFNPVIVEDEKDDHLNYHTPRAKVTIDSRSYSPAKTKTQSKPRVRVDPRPSTKKIKKEPMKNTSGKRKSTLKKTSRSKRPQNPDYFARTTNTNLAPQFANFATAKPMMTHNNYSSLRSPNDGSIGHRRAYTRHLNQIPPPIDAIRGSVFTPIKTMGPFIDRSLSPFVAHQSPNFHHHHQNGVRRQPNRNQTYTANTRNGYRTPPPNPRTRQQRQNRQKIAQQQAPNYNHSRNASFNSTSRNDTDASRQVIRFDEGEKSLTITGNFSTIDMPKEKWVFDNTHHSSSRLNGKEPGLFF